MAKVKKSITLDPEVWEWAEQMAEKSDRKPSYIINYACQEIMTRKPATAIGDESCAKK